MFLLHNSCIYNNVYLVLDTCSQQFSPKITPGNEEYVHHMLIYICDGLDNVNLGQGGPCNSVDRRIRNCRVDQIGAWAVGGEVSGQSLDLLLQDGLP